MEQRVPESEPRAFTVVTEVLHNTRCVLLTVLGSEAATAEVRLRLGAGRAVALVEVNGTSWTCLLPKNMIWGQTGQLLRSADHVALRLAIEPFGPCESVLLQGKAREAPEAVVPRLQQANNSLMCRACNGVAFVSGAPFARVLRLPSAYWQELAELWGCHTETFEAAPNKEIAIEKGVLYVGASHFVVHGSHTDGLVRGADERLRCRKCGAAAGRQTRGGPVALFFHAVTDGRGLWSNCTQQKRLARQVFEISRGSGDMRFFAGVQGPIKLSISLVNWDSTIAVKEGAQPEPVLKVRYGEVASAPPAEGEDELGKVVVLDWEEQEVRLMWDALQENRSKFLAASVAGKEGSFLWL